MSAIGKFSIALFGAFVSLGISSCATIFTSSSESVTLNSDPPGANYQYGAFTGKTPATIMVPRGALTDWAIFSMPGYRNSTVPVSKGIQGATWFNILFPLGFVIDFASGNAYSLKPSVIYGTLERETAAATPAPLAIPPPPATTPPPASGT